MPVQRRTYEFTFLNVDGGPLWTHRETVAANADCYYALLGDQDEQTDETRAILDNPEQHDKRALYSLRIRRVGG